MKGQKLIGFFFDCQIYLLFFIALQKKLKNLFAETDVKYFLQKLKRKGDFSNGMKRQFGLPGKGVGKAGVCSLAEWYKTWYYHSSRAKFGM